MASKKIIVETHEVKEGEKTYLRCAVEADGIETYADCLLSATALIKWIAAANDTPAKEIAETLLEAIQHDSVVNAQEFIINKKE